MSDMFGPASLSVGQTLSSFITFMPKLSDVRKTDANANPEMVGDVRMAEIAGLTVSLGVGAIVSSLTGSPIPIFAAAVMAIILIVLYESALRGNRPWEPQRAERATDA